MKNELGCVVGIGQVEPGSEQSTEAANVLEVNAGQLMEVMETLLNDEIADAQKIEVFVQKCLAGCYLTWEISSDLEEEDRSARKDSFMRVKHLSALVWRGQRLNLNFPLVWRPEVVQSRIQLLQTFLNLLDKRQHKVSQAREEDNVTRETVAMLIHNARNQVTVLIGGLDLVCNAVEQWDVDRANAFVLNSREQYRETMKRFSQVTALAMRLAMSDDRFEPRCQLYTVDQLFFEIEKQFNDHNIIIDGDISTESEVMVDIGLFQQVLENMVMNALKYGHSRALPLTIRLQDQQGMLRVEVEDRGNGFSGPAERLFVVGYRGNNQQMDVTGHGLGLAFCKRMVEKMKGEVFANNNKEGIGATFGFALPIKK